MQRFGGALNLNVHVHALVFNGVHVMTEDRRVRFRALLRPKPRGRCEWTETIAGLVTRSLRRKGPLREDVFLGRAEAASVLDACQAVSMRGVAVRGRARGVGYGRSSCPGWQEERSRGLTTGTP